MFWVYVLEDPQGKFYIGQTGNPISSRNSAMQRERQIKRMKSAKWIRTHLLTADPAAVNPDESGL